MVNRGDLVAKGAQLVGVVDTWLAYTISDVVGRTVCETPIVTTNSNVDTYIYLCYAPKSMSRAQDDGFLFHLANKGAYHHSGG